MDDKKLTPSTVVTGLFYMDNAIDNPSDIIDDLDEREWKPLTDSKNSRIVQHYGFLYDYKTHKIGEKGEKFPKCIRTLAKNLTKICENAGLISRKYTFNQCIINNYLPGQGISKHIDVKSYGDVIGCYTLNGGSIMRFTSPEGVTHDVYVKPNSLYVMSGDARYKWTHEMPSCKYDTVDGKKLRRERRISITFRNVEL